MKYNLVDECIGSYFKNKRLAHKYSGRYVADRVGITKTTYFYYEVGKVSMPLETMKKLLELYNEDGNELLDEMQNTFNNYLLKLYAYLNGYTVTKTISSTREEMLKEMTYSDELNNLE